MRWPIFVVAIGAFSSSPAFACSPNLSGSWTPKTVASEAKRVVAEADAIVDVVIVRTWIDKTQQPRTLLKVINRLKGPLVDHFVVTEPEGACELPIRVAGKFGRVLLKRATDLNGKSVWFAPSYFNIGGEPLSDAFDRAIDTEVKSRRSRRFARPIWN